MAESLIERVGQVSPGMLQGIAADLVGSDERLLLPLRNLVSLPGFRALIPLAGSGRGLPERDALLQDIRETFSPQIVEALGEVLSGFLALPSPHGSDAQDQEPTTRDPAPTPRTQAQPSPPAQEPQPNPLYPAAPPPSRSGPSAALFLFVAVLALGAGVVLGTRVTPFCLWTGQCHAAPSAASTRALQEAQKAVASFKSATDLPEYQKASADLDSSLIRLNGMSLVPEQRAQIQKLQGLAATARTRAAQEQADRERLLKAREDLSSAREASGQERLNLLDQATTDLDRIGSNSFAAQDASELRERITSLRREQPAKAASPSEEPGQSSPQTQEAPAPVQAPARPWSPAPQYQAPAPRSYQAPLSAPAPAHRPSSSSAPYRSQPLF